MVFVPFRLKTGLERHRAGGRKNGQSLSENGAGQACCTPDENKNQSVLKNGKRERIFSGTVSVLPPVSRICFAGRMAVSSAVFCFCRLDSQEPVEMAVSAEVTENG